MTTIYLKDIPEDLAEHILKVQGEQKCKKKVGKYSQCQAVLHIIREHKKSTDKSK